MFPARLNDGVTRMARKLSRRGLYEFLRDRFCEIAPGAEVLSVGAGGDIGALLKQCASERGFNVVSLDVDVARNPDLVGDLCEFEFGERKFDVVVMSEVLEHIHLPHVAIAKVLQALNHGGRLILSTPFMLPIHEAPRDFYRYTKYGLEFLLRDFSAVAIKERNSYLESIGVLCVRIWHAPSRPARVLGRILVPLVYLQAPLLRLLDRTLAVDVMTTGYVVTADK